MLAHVHSYQPDPDGSQKSMDLSFGSTAHGAGRTMSRGAAKRKYNEQSVKKALESRGIYVKALTREGIVEEIPYNMRYFS